jgi:hypothetical protein
MSQQGAFFVLLVRILRGAAQYRIRHKQRLGGNIIRRLPAYVLTSARSVARLPLSIPQIGDGRVFNGRDTKITTAALICRSPRRKLRLYLVR